jgi:alpha-beta hydrolase superfamily lysophospholipase
MAPTSTDPALAWASDVLGPPFEAATLALRPDAEGEAIATLVRHGSRSRKAVLYVHGFSDYYFNTALAEYWAGRGYDFHALDLRGYGRSMRPGRRRGYVTDLTAYDEELDLAWAEVTRDHDHVVLMAHSTGGLVVPLWADRRRELLAGVLGAVVLNAPWLDMQGSALLRHVGMRVVDRLGRTQPTRQITREADGFYARALHRDHEGEWEFDLSLKPIESFPVYAGWLRAIRQGHQRVARGLDVPAPVLVLCSARSGHPTSVHDDALRSTDVVLDVEQIRRRSPLLGSHVTLVMLEGAIHEVTLSPEPARKRAYEEIDRFLAAYVEDREPDR